MEIKINSTELVHAVIIETINFFNINYTEEKLQELVKTISESKIYQEAAKNMITVER